MERSARLKFGSSDASWIALPTRLEIMNMLGLSSHKGGAWKDLKDGVSRDKIAPGRKVFGTIGP